MLYGTGGILAQARARDRRHDARGQIMVMFTLVIVVLMALAAVVVDAGLLRTDSARLQNALDAGALAAAHSLPATSTNVGAVTTTASSYVSANFPGVAAPTTSFRCIIGVDPTTGAPRLIDMPAVCNVVNAATRTDWVCTAALCWAPCDPVLNSADVCNTVVLTDNATRQYTFGRAVGINSANTGALQAAACTGPCGPTSPVDVVLIIDRTLSMQNSGSIPNLKTAADAVLSAYDPAFQRVALGMLGPTTLNETCVGSGTSAPAVHAVPQEPGVTSVTEAGASSAATASGGATLLNINRAGAPSAGDLLVAAITVAGGTTYNVTPRASDGWTLLSRTDNTTNVSLFTYYKVVIGSEPSPYQWTFTLATNGTPATIRASGGIIRYTGVDPANPINVAGIGNSNTGTAVQANSVTTTVANTELVGFFATGANTTFTVPTGGGWTERFDQRIGTTNGPATEGADFTVASAGSTGTKTATAAATGSWVAQTFALQPIAPEVYGTAIPADLPRWIPIDFTGTDGAGPAVTYREPYVDPTTTPPTVNANSHLASAIDCFTNSSATPATTLKTPLDMATYYLQTYGRTGVPKGIILETDGTPQQGSVGNIADFTCQAAADAAQRAKDAGIEVFTIGYGLGSNTCYDGSSGYPSSANYSHSTPTSTLLGNMATGPIKGGGSACVTAAQINTENTDGDHFYCQATGSDLSSVFRAAALALAGGSRLVQLYPQPVVTSIVQPGLNPSAGGATITINGKYFTEAYSVTVGGVAASLTVVSDSQIVAVTPAGPANTQVDVQVSTPGGSSNLVAGSHYTYGP